MKKGGRKWIIAIVLWGVVAVVYRLIIRPALGQGLGTSDSLLWLGRLVYPDLDKVWAQYPDDFLLFVVDQLWWRVSIISLGLILAMGTFHLWRAKAAAYWSLTCHSREVLMIRVLFYGMALFFVRDTYWELDALRGFEPLAQTHSFYRLVPIVLPWPLLACIVIVQWLSGVWAMARGGVWASVVFAITFVYLEGALLCFQGISHHYATFGYAAMLMPLLMHYAESAIITPRNGSVIGWPLQLIRISVVLPYTLSGLEKLCLSGLNWSLPQALPIPAAVVPIVVLAVLAFQLGFIVAVLYRKLLYFYIPAGILFHVAIYYWMGVGAWVHPWWVCYLFLVNWDGAIATIRGWVGAGRER